jgi:hypothetical protein
MDSLASPIASSAAAVMAKTRSLVAIAHPLARRAYCGW